MKRKTLILVLMLFSIAMSLYAISQAVLPPIADGPEDNPTIQALPAVDSQVVYTDVESVAKPLPPPEPKIPYVELISYVVAIASILTNLTPSNKDNVIVNVVSKLLNILAINWRSKR